MEGLHHFKFLYQRFLSSTMGWPEDAQMGYMKLLTVQFERGGIPADLKEIGGISTGAKKHWKRIKQKFGYTNEDGTLYNKVMAGIREEAIVAYMASVENGKKGGRPKKPNPKPAGYPKNNPGLDPSLNPQGNPTRNENPVLNSLKEKVAVLPERQQRLFEMFRRSAAEHITGEELLAEVGKFENKYSHLHINQCGSVINAWVSNIGRIESERAEQTANPSKTMVH